MVSAFVALLGSRPLLQWQAGDEHEEYRKEEGTENGCIERLIGASMDVAIRSWRYSNHEDSCLISAQILSSSAAKLTELHDDFSKIIRMPGPGEESNIAHLALVFRFTSEDVFLNIRDTLQDKPNSEQDHTGNVSTSSKVRLVEFGDIRRVENCYGERDSPDPKHLKDPEPQEWEKFVPFVVEAVIFPSFQDAEQEESG